MNNVKIVGLMLLSVLSVDAYSIDKSVYLASLEREANGLSHDRSTQKTNSIAHLKSKKASVKVVQYGILGGEGTSFNDGLSFQQFGIALKDNFMGSFYYYKRLNQLQKNYVYQSYQKNPELNKIRASILKAK